MYPHVTPERTAAAPEDALMIARRFLAGDEMAAGILLGSSDPYSCTLQLAGWLRTAIQTALEYGAGEEFDDQTVDDVLGRWLDQIRKEARR